MPHLPGGRALPPGGPLRDPDSELGPRGHLTARDQAAGSQRGEKRRGPSPGVPPGVRRCGVYSVSPKVLDAFLGWLATRKSHGTVVKTMRDAVGAKYRPLPRQ
ncbi:hypothetical protein ACFQX6_31110 [Streptosporangium lutulentum]